ncbi:Protein charlatan [Orchesella cincta]|uniref:Protein charlatan n=1 Tax=Orchesella cincta TaxID=48709 RepID=A0A1D2NDF2_ORCCI|nr:Protein charlatan [Orchesella cincta]
MELLPQDYIGEPAQDSFAALTSHSTEHVTGNNMDEDDILRIAIPSIESTTFQGSWFQRSDTLSWTQSKIATYSYIHRLFRCVDCGFEGFLSKVSEHWLGCHCNLRVLQCPRCPSNYTRVRSFRHHWATMHGEILRASFINENFYMKQVTLFLSALKTEVEIQSASVEEQKIFMCSNCAYQTSRKDLYNRHRQAHTNEKPYSCYLCDSKFSRSDNAKTHFLRKHREHFYDKSKIRKNGFENNPTTVQHYQQPQQQVQLEQVDMQQTQIPQQTLMQTSLSQPYQASQSLQRQDISDVQQQHINFQIKQQQQQMHLQQRHSTVVSQEKSIVQSQLQPQMQLKQVRQCMPLQPQQQVVEGMHHFNMQKSLPHPQNQVGIQGKQIIQHQWGMHLQSPPSQQGFLDIDHTQDQQDDASGIRQQQHSVQNTQVIQHYHQPLHQKQRIQFQQQAHLQELHTQQPSLLMQQHSLKIQEVQHQNIELQNELQFLVQQVQQLKNKMEVVQQQLK